MDPETFKALEQWAAAEFRSVNGQIEYIIAKALKDAGRGKTRGETKGNPAPEKD